MNESTILQLIERDLSMAARIRATVTGLAGLGMAGMLAVLWATEPGVLPARTAVAFAAMIIIGLAWAVFAGWVLTRRRPLYARDSIVAGRLAVTFSAAFAVVGPIVAVSNGSEAWWAVLLVGLAFVAVASFLLGAATRRRNGLLQLKVLLSGE